MILDRLGLGIAGVFASILAWSTISAAADRIRLDADMLINLSGQRPAFGTRR